MVVAQARGTNGPTKITQLALHFIVQCSVPIISHSHMLALQQAWKGNIWEHISFSAGINLPVDHFLILSGVFLGLSTKLKNMLFIDVYCNVSPKILIHMPHWAIPWDTSLSTTSMVTWRIISG
jgi:hypothetical protein